MSPVGLPIPTSIADTVAPAWRAKLRIVERPSAKAENIAAVTFGSRALIVGSCRDAVIGGEHEADGTLDRGQWSSLPAGDPGRQVVEPLQGARRSEDVGGSGVDGGDRRLVRLG